MAFLLSREEDTKTVVESKVSFAGYQSNNCCFTGSFRDQERSFPRCP